MTLPQANASLTIVLSLSLKSKPMLFSTRRETVNFAELKSSPNFEALFILLSAGPCDGSADSYQSAGKAHRQRLFLYLPPASFSGPPAPRCAGSPGTVACWPPQTHSPGAAGVQEPCHRLPASS